MTRSLDEILADPSGLETQPEGDVSQSPALATTDLAVPERHPSMNLSEVKSLAQVMIDSALHRGVSLNDAVTMILIGREYGMAPALAMQNVIVVKGNATLKAAAVGSLIKQSGRYNYKVAEHTADSCTIEFYEKWDDQWQMIGESTFTMADARQAGVAHGVNWNHYPRNMLWARAMTNGARWYTPDVFGGPIYTPEEINAVTVDTGPAESVEYKVVENSVDDFTESKVSTASLKPLDSLERSAYVAGDDGRNEPCPLHGGETFFKRGKMRGHAHKVGNDWCNWNDVAKGLMADCNGLFEQCNMNTAMEREQYALIQMPDLQGVDIKAYRVQDWFCLKERLIDYTVNSAANEED